MSELPMLLLVEDEQLIALTLTDELVGAGFKVVTAHNGDVALDELRGDRERFKAVVTDVRLGTAVDGWMVAHTAREMSPSIAVVYMSGDSAAGWAANGVPDSVMLSKPFAAVRLSLREPPPLKAGHG